MMHRNVLTAVALSTFVAGPVWADSDALFDALQLPEIIDVMRLEGLSYGAQVGEELIGDRLTPVWGETVETIYELEPLKAIIKAEFSTALEGEDVTPMLAFFTSEPGRTLMGLEVSARRAMLDDAVDEASQDMLDLARSDETDRFQLIAEFVDANDLIETNVISAMNANVAFYNGLSEGGAFGGVLTQDQILSDVYDQETDIRSNTSDWIYRFLLMAYAPMEDADIQAYIDFSNTDAGRRLNTALFIAFEDTLNDISYSLGFEAARMLSTQDL